jgi:N-acetylglucosamine kinase-like BadF-type ATPase
MGMDKEKMVRKIAGFSKVVIEVAKMGDEDANYILESAVRELLVMCLKVHRVSEVQEVALHGGLFRDTYFREKFISLLKRYSINVVGYKFDGARGVAKFTMASGGLI